MYSAFVDVRVAIAAAINAIDNFAAVAARQIYPHFFVVDLLHMRQQLFTAIFGFAAAPNKISRPDDS